MSAQRVKDVLANAPKRSPLTGPGMPASYVGGEDCEGSKFHNPRPLVTWPFNLSTVFAKPGHVADNDVIHLCSTCRDNLLTYLAVLDTYSGATPQAVRRDFGNIIRELGDRAWAHYSGRTSGGVTSA